MSFIPNNSSGNAVVSDASVFFEKAVVISGAFGIPSTYTSDFIRIQGLPNIALTANGSADGSSPDYPDSTVGSALVTLEIASGNSGEFESGIGLSSQKLGEWLCPLTDSATFDVPTLYQFVQCSAKFIRIKVNFLPNQISATTVAKLYVRLHASA